MGHVLQFAERDPSLNDELAKQQIDTLREALLSKQYERLQKADQTLLIVVAGMDGVGKGTAINTLNTWLDPRHVHTLAFGKLSEEEAMRPLMWRYWNSLPARGQTGLVFGSWYAPLMKELGRKEPDPAKIALYTHLINRFEAQLAYQGVQVLKLWFHLSAQAQLDRCATLMSDPNTAWRVSKADLKVHKQFNRLRNAATRTINLTHRNYAPWVVIPSADQNLRDVSLAKVVLQAMDKPIVPRQVKEPHAFPFRLNVPTASLLSPPPEEPVQDYDAELLHWQGRLSCAVRSKAFRKHSLVLVFEGRDAAGKGGTIRRLTEALDVRTYDIHPISAPNAVELARPYLWRFWRKLPRLGEISIFDRSWYGRVLVERVEKLISRAAWQRSYEEINEFEAQLLANGTAVIKFWLDIDKDEQLKRFKAREETPFKAYKITEDDWRNREKWTAYQRAAEEMFAQTDTHMAPWHIVPSKDKKAARIQVLRIVVETLESLDEHMISLNEPALSDQFSEQV